MKQFPLFFILSVEGLLHCVKKSLNTFIVNRDTLVLNIRKNFLKIFDYSSNPNIYISTTGTTDYDSDD